MSRHEDSSMARYLFGDVKSLIALAAFLVSAGSLFVAVLALSTSKQALRQTEVFSEPHLTEYADLQDSSVDEIKVGLVNVSSSQAFIKEVLIAAGGVCNRLMAGIPNESGDRYYSSHGKEIVSAVDNIIKNRKLNQNITQFTWNSVYPGAWIQKDQRIEIANVAFTSPLSRDLALEVRDAILQVPIAFLYCNDAQKDCQVSREFTVKGVPCATSSAD